MAKLIKLGRSFVVVIPKEIVRAMSIEDKQFEFKIKDMKTLLVKIKSQ